MKRYNEYNPISITIHFLMTVGIAMFSMNPILLSISLVFSILTYIFYNDRKNKTSILFIIVIFIIMAIINPLTYHNGKTILFVINDNPITLEATIYGIVAATMIMTVFYWFMTLSAIMTSDKMLFLFGRISPKLALILSMSLRYIPLFIRQAKKIDNSQKAMGLYKSDNIIDTIKIKVNEFSILTTWALENGIITADSMAARGYGYYKRTSFSIFKFTTNDLVLTIVSLLLGAGTVIGIALGKLDFVFYPEIHMVPVDFVSIISYASYLILTFIPTFLEMEEKVKWHYLKSKI